MTGRMLSRSLLVFAALATAAWFGSRVVGQEPDDASRLRGLNGQLLQRLGQLNGATAARSNVLRREAAEILGQRLTVLASLIEQDPAQAAQLALPTDVIDDVVSAFAGARDQLESRGAWQGPIEYAIEDGPGFRSNRKVITMDTGNETLSIHFTGAEPVGLMNGDTLQVRGVRAGRQVAAESSARLGARVTSARAPKPPPTSCSTLGAQPTIVLLVTMPGASVPPEITPGIMADTFFNPAGNTSILTLTDFWRENSSGATWATGAIAPGPNNGWYTLDRVYSDDETNQVRTAAIAAADGDVDFTLYKRVYIVMNGSTPGSSSWDGRGTIGCATLSSQDGNFIASTAWQQASTMLGVRHGVQIIIHEGGHNLGLDHSNSREFGVEALGAPGAAGQVDVYNDFFAEMGSGFGHYAAPHKAKLGWLTTDLQTVTGSGAYVVQPVEAPGSVRALKIRRGTDNANWLWLEYRQPIGLYDTRLASPYVTNYLTDAESHIYSGGLIHYEDASTGSTSHLLDFTPASRSGFTLHPAGNVDDDWFDSALAGSWTDPYTGMSITTWNPTASSLGVQVSYGSGPCVEANPTVSLSPSNPGAKRGDTVTFTVTVTSKDSASCTGRTYNVSSSLPPGWTSTLSPTSVVLAAGGSAQILMTKTVPSNAAYATYALDAAATNGSFSGQGTANVTVKPGK